MGIIRLTGTRRAAALAVGVALLHLGASSVRADYQVIYPFTQNTEASGNFAVSGNTLYGTALYTGNAQSDGSIFSINRDGSNFNTVHPFTGATADGANPAGGVTLSGSTLYGSTRLGGTQNLGAVFSIGVGGGSTTLLHSFRGSATDGVSPLGTTLLYGSTLYGLTSSSNTGPAFGTIYKVGIDGSGYQVIHTFQSEPDDGAAPAYGHLIVSGSTLYGLTAGGGSASDGALFQLNPDGSGFKLLHSFTGSTTDGLGPQGSLVQVGNKFYGTTERGGMNNQGTIFEINTDGTGFAVIHSFVDNASNTDGTNPKATLVADGNILYGTTPTGGADLSGVLFQINADGSGYQIAHTFVPNTIDGDEPDGSLTLIGNTIYGTTEFEGANGYGGIFALTVPEPTSGMGLLGAGVLCLARRRRAKGSRAVA